MIAQRSRLRLYVSGAGAALLPWSRSGYGAAALRMDWRAADARASRFQRLFIVNRVS